MKILVIDDDREIGEAIELYLTSFNHQVHCVLRPSEAMQYLASHPVDVILLDIMLPEKDGLEVCRDIRYSGQPWANTAIIMLSARGDVMDRVVGLELGADDYLAKPFEPRELLARISSVTRRQQRQGAALSTEADSTDGLSLCRMTRSVDLDGQAVELSTMEFELLLLLSGQPGKKWSRDELTSALRGTDAELQSRAVDTVVSRLRHKLGDVQKPVRFIQTIWGHGYCFIDESVRVR